MIGAPHAVLGRMSKPSRLRPARHARGLRAAALVWLFVLGLGGAAPAEAATVAGIGPLPADAADFSITSFHAEYLLSRGEDGAAELSTTETIVARFPERDQNHGIVRTIPTRYDGVRTSPRILSVTDADGTPLPYSEDDGDGLSVQIGDADSYVHGTRTYVIAYTQRNVIRELPPTAQTAQTGQEFYWNVNGTGWDQPFEAVSAEVALAAGLRSATTAEYACYQGDDGAGTPCASSERTGETFRFASTGLQANQTLTVAVGFRAGTFVVPVSPLTAWWAIWPPLGLAAVAVICLVFTAVARVLRWRDAAGRGTVVPEYAPPAATDLFTLGQIAGRMDRAVAASIVSLAVRGILRIQDAGGQYELVFLGDPGPDGTALPADVPVPDAELGSGWPAESGARRPLSHPERALIAALFGPSPAVHSVVVLRDRDAVRAREVARVTGAQPARSEMLGLRARPGTALPVLPRLGSALTAVAAIGVSSAAILAAGEASPATVGAMALAGAALIGTLVAQRRPRLLTRAGALLSEYLEGNRIYIRLAEQDRLAFLQGVQTAERSAADGRVRLYERMLPLAIILGLEKTWAAALATAFADAEQTPEWYGGPGGGILPAAAFASWISGFNAAVASNVVTAPSSSGGAGSSGGGSAGGGGGGGGGGGW